MKKVKPLTATEAVQKMNYYKAELQRITNAQAELNKKLKAKNKEIESLKEKLKEPVSLKHTIEVTNTGMQLHKFECIDGDKK